MQIACLLIITLCHKKGDKYICKYKTKQNHSNIYIKRMGDKKIKNKGKKEIQNTRTQSKGRDNLNISYPFTHKSADYESEEKQ